MNNGRNQTPLVRDPRTTFGICGAAAGDFIESTGKIIDPSITSIPLYLFFSLLFSRPKNNLPIVKSTIQKICKNGGRAVRGLNAGKGSNPSSLKFRMEANTTNRYTTNLQCELAIF